MKCRNVLVVVWIALLVSTSAAQEKIKFPVSASSKTLGYSPLWVAWRQGFFEKNGLDVQVVLVSGADKSVMALVGGSTYSAAGAADAMITVVDKGLDLVAVGGVINGLTHMILGAKKFKTYEDLRGATVGSSGLTSGTAFVLRKVLKAKGLEFPRDLSTQGVRRDDDQCPLGIVREEGEHRFRLARPGRCLHHCRQPAPSEPGLVSVGWIAIWPVWGDGRHAEELIK